MCRPWIASRARSTPSPCAFTHRQPNGQETILGCGFIYGDGVKDNAFAGLEGGVKHYVLEKTYFLARVEYQFLFSSTSDATDAFRDSGVWAYTVGLGYNF